MKIFTRVCIFLMTVLLFIFDFDQSFAEERRELSLQECLNLALEWHPSLKKAQGSIQAQEAALEATRVNDRATVNLSGSASYSGSYEDSLRDARNSESLSLALSKTLYDSGKNKLNKEIAQENLFGSRQSKLNTQVNVVASAKKAYFDLVLKILNRNVETEKLKNYEEHLKQAQGLYDVGVSAFIDVTKAETDVAGARVSLLKAESDISVAQEALRVAMGVPDFVEFAPTTDLLLPESVGELEQLLTTALEDRSDYRQALSTVKVRELSIKSAARSNSPTINGQVGSTFSKREGSDSSSEYTIGISINIPVYDAGATAAKVNEARALADQAKADVISLKNSLTYDVRSAAISLANARERASSAEASVRYALDNLQLAQGRYEVGVGNAIELSDAVALLANSRYTYYQALYDAQSARADLDLALGHFPDELNARDALVAM